MFQFEGHQGEIANIADEVQRQPAGEFSLIQRGSVFLFNTGLQLIG